MPDWIDMPKILLSYRRDDSAPYAGRIADRLRGHFGADNVFIDIDTIQPGDDFVRAIESSVQSCDAVVAVIGTEWIAAADGSGRRRLERSDDFVRLEIATALARNVRVVPALVGGAGMPEADELPSDLAGLARRQALEISDGRFHHDIDRLIEALSGSQKGPGKASSAPAPEASGRQATRRRMSPRAWLAAGLLLALAASVGTWMVTGGRPFDNGSARVVDVAPGQGRSAASPRPVTPGAIHKMTLGKNEEAYFKVSTPLRTARVVLDARCSTARYCSLGSALSVLDADGTVVKDAAIRVTGFDVGFREIRAVSLEAAARMQFKLVNASGEKVDYWLTVLDGAGPATVALYGTDAVRPLTVGADGSGTVEAGAGRSYIMRLPKGEYAVTLDLSVAPRDPESLAGYVAMVNAAGGEERVVVPITQFIVSARSTRPLSIDADGSYLFRVQSAHSAGMTYMFKVTRR